MNPTPDTRHLTPDEIELWAQGLLPAARDVHLAQCAECRQTAERERRLLRELACAFPSMSWNRTVTLTRGKPRVGRLPTQMAPGEFRAAGVAHGGTAPRIRFCSMRPVKVS